MLIMNNSVFVHVPRTGGSWCKQALIRSVVGGATWHSGHGTIAGTPPSLLEGRRSFAFTRPPLEWYRSFFAYAVWKRWKLNPLFGAMPDLCRSDTYPAFLEKILEYTPGFAAKLMAEMTHGVDIVMAYSVDDMPGRLMSALRQAGESFNSDLIRTTQPQNRTPPEYQALTDGVYPEIEPLILEAECIIGKSTV